MKQKRRLSTISVILPAYNEEENIKSCLESIRHFDYPQDKVEIIVVDDCSTDQTVKIAKSFGAKIYYSGEHNIERSKSIGLQHASGQFILLLDADNIFVTADWLKKSVSIFQDNKNLVGIQTGRCLYQRKDHPANRYCALFGINKPLQFYLRKRVLLMATENHWMYKESLVKEKKDYFLVRFNTDNLPTMGSNGYLTKKNLLFKTTVSPSFFHMDTIYELVEMDYQDFAILKQPIIHNFTSSFLSYFKKLYRDTYLYFQYRSYRKYKYQTERWRFLLALLVMITIIIPLLDSLKGYLKKRDVAWFLHPFFCFTSPIVSGIAGIDWYWNSHLGIKRRLS